MNADVFKNFERREHDRVAGGYHDFFEPVTGGAITALLDDAGVRPGCRALDVATGPGAVAAAAAARGASRVVGADLSPRMVALAARLYPGVEFREADAEALPFDNGAFDAVASNFGIGHFPGPERAIAEFVRVLAPGGRAAVSWWLRPLRNRLNGVFFEAMAEAGAPLPPGVPEGPAVFRFSDEAELRALLSGAGLDEVTTREVTWAHTVPSAEAWWFGGLGSLARASANVLGQEPAMLARIRAAFDRLVEPHAAEGGYRVPCGAWVASGRKR